MRLLLIAIVFLLSACEDDAILDPTDEGPEEGSYGMLHLGPSGSLQTEPGPNPPQGKEAGRGHAVVKNPKLF